MIALPVHLASFGGSCPVHSLCSHLLKHHGQTLWYRLWMRITRSTMPAKNHYRQIKSIQHLFSDYRYRSGNLGIIFDYITDVWKSGFLDSWISGIPDFRNSGNPDFRKSGFPDVRKFGCPDFRKSGYPNIRITDTESMSQAIIFHYRYRFQTFRIISVVFFAGMVLRFAPD